MQATELKSIGLFKGVPGSVLDRAASYFGQTRSYKKGQDLIVPGEFSSDVFFLFEGAVRLSMLTDKGELISYREIEPFDYFGWLSVLDDGPRLTGAVASEDCQVFSVPQDQFKKILALDFRIQENFLRRISATIRNYTSRIQALTFLSARERIIHELSRRFEGVGKVFIIPSHEDLATWAGTSRETVTRTLKNLENEGLIRRQGGGYAFLKDPGPAAGWLED